YGHRQERFHQLAHDVDSVQGESGRSENGAGGPEAAGAKSLREHSSLDRARGDRSENRLQRVAKRDARNGESTEIIGAARGAKHRPVQPHVQEGTLAVAVRQSGRDRAQAASLPDYRNRRAS